MKSSSTASPKLASVSRCIYTSSHGHRCRSLALQESRFCFAHQLQAKSDADSLVADLSKAAGNLSSPDDVSRVLAKIFLALLEDRISLKKAGTLGFLGQMLIRSHREIEYYRKTHRQNEQESKAHEQHQLFLKQQDERKARIEARDAELRRAEAEQAAQAAKEATQKAAAAAKAARKEARATVKKPASSVSLSEAQACPTRPELRREDSQRASASDTPLNVGAALCRPTSECDSPACPEERGDPRSAAALPNLTTPSTPSIAPPTTPQLDHFFPNDPTLAPGLQTPRNTQAPPYSENPPSAPDAEELRWRQLSRQYARSRRR